MTMKLQNDIKHPSGGNWYRCSRVEFVGDTVRWELRPSSRYSFFEAYKKKPHHQLIGAKDDAALCSFMRAWGPLYFSWPWEWANCQPIEPHRHARDTLIAMTEILASVEKRERQRSALTQWLELGHKTHIDDVLLVPVRQTLQIPGDPMLGFDQGFRDWLDRATPKQVNLAIHAVVPLLSPTLFSPNQFSVGREGSRDVVRAELVLSSLGEALQWMVWHDYFLHFPYRFCEECGSVFGMRNNHDTKFCPGGPCGHRRAARESYRRQNEQREKQQQGKKERA